MRNIITALIVALVLVTVGGVAILGIRKSRQSAGRTQCANNLKQLGLGLHYYHDEHKQFPPGTCANPDLPPEKRFSWMIEICPQYIEGVQASLKVNRKAAWDAAENFPLPAKFFINDPDGVMVREGYFRGTFCLICPFSDLDLSSTWPTSYLEVAGVGAKAGELPVEHMHAGLFGYDRKVTLNDCKHGSATTMMVAESLDGGPWMAGGRSTMRGFEPEKLPYFGVNGQFASNHHGGSNVMMADGSVRFFTNAMSPRVIEAMAALAGDKDLARFDD